MLTPANAKAYAILSLLYSKLTDQELQGLIVQPFLKHDEKYKYAEYHEENGFSVYLNFHETRPIKMAFCECPNSKDIITYRLPMLGEKASWSWLNPKQDDKIFKPESYVTAANYIVECLRS